MSEAIIISKPGINVGTVTSPDDVIFSSQYNTLKYYTTGSGTISISSNGTTVVTTQAPKLHNLGYIPFFVCFGGAVGTSANNVPLVETTIGVTRYLSAFADSTNLYITLQSNTSGTLTYYYFYKIYQNNTRL